jgi:hypothetical protein
LLSALKSRILRCAQDDTHLSQRSFARNARAARIGRRRRGVLFAEDQATFPTVETRQVDPDRDTRPEPERLECRSCLRELSIEIAAALGDEQAAGRQERTAQLDYDGQRTDGTGRRPVIRIAVRGIAPDGLGTVGHDLDVAQTELLDGLAQKGSLFPDGLDERHAQLRKRDLQRYAGHATAAADVDQPQRRAGSQAVEHRHCGRERIEKVAGFDLGGVGNTGQVDPPIAFAQRGAKLIEEGKLGIAELDL